MIEKLEKFEPEYSFDIQGDFKDLEKSEFTFLPLDDEIDIDEDYIKQLFQKFHKDRTFKVSIVMLLQKKNHTRINHLLQVCLQQTAQNSTWF